MKGRGGAGNRVETKKKSTSLNALIAPMLFNADQLNLDLRLGMWVQFDLVGHTFT